MCPSGTTRAGNKDKQNETHESLRNDKAVALGVTIVDWVINTEDNIPDLNDRVVTRGIPCLQSPCSIQRKGKNFHLETILGALGEVFE